MDASEAPKLYDSDLLAAQTETQSEQREEEFIRKLMSPWEGKKWSQPQG